MKTYVVFAVVVQPASVVVRRDAFKTVQAKDAEAALKEAANSITLQAGESLAVVLMKDK